MYDFAEGFGSVYGRYVRKRLCQRLIEKHDIHTVLEAPCNAESYFASPGTQSVIFAQEGCSVTLVHPDKEIVNKTRDFWEAFGIGVTRIFQHSDLYNLPFRDNQFDLVWNFDYIPLFDDPARFVAEMTRVSCNLIMIIVPNSKNIGYPLHALLNIVKRRESPWGSREWMNTKSSKQALQYLGLEIIETGLVDMPPWPGFDALNIIGQFLRRSTVEASEDNRTDEDVEHMMSKLTFIEYASLPNIMKTPFAHQLFILARKPKT